MKKSLKNSLVAFGPADRLPKDEGSALPTNVVHLANSSRFVEGHLRQDLTGYAIGYRDPSNLEGILEFLAPAIPVPARFSFRKASNAEEFYSEVDDIRAIGGDFKLVRYTGEEVEARTYNKGLVVVIDTDQVEDESELALLEQNATERLMRRLFRNEIRRAATLIDANAENVNVTWSTADGKDPDADITAGLILAADSSGVRPNRIAYGDTSWDKRSLSCRAQATAGGFASSMMTQQQLAGFFGVDQVEVIRARYQSTASAKSQIISNKVLAFYAEKGMSTEDSSNIKRFVSKGGGKMFRVYVTQGANPKLRYVTVEHHSHIAATSTLGVRKWTVA